MTLQGRSFGLQQPQNTSQIKRLGLIESRYLMFQKCLDQAQHRSPDTDWEVPTSPWASQQKAFSLYKDHHGVEILRQQT